MKKNIILVALILSLCSLGLAMSGDNKVNNNTNTLPASNFSALIEDNQSVQTFVSQLNWNGKLYIEAQHGSSKITIPFEKIQSLQITDKATTTPESNLAVVVLKNQTSLEIALDRKSKLYGMAEFGQIEIVVNVLRQVTFN